MRQTHGLRHHPLYGTWSNILSRCYNPGVKSFQDYGARGITVCERWRIDAEAFIRDVGLLLGPRPPGMTLDRIDNDGNYEPGNIRWATRSQQTWNSRRRIDGDRRGPLYALWWRLMRRCPGEVHAPWRDWPVFRDDITRMLPPRPPEHRFDRLDPERPYEPGNVGWVTPAEQVNLARQERWAGHERVKGHPLYRRWNTLRVQYRALLHEPWNDARQFIADIEALLGPRPDGTVFRRTDPDGRFEPGNVCWGPPGRPSRK